MDVVGERFDAGVRIGESVDRDIIAVRIGRELKLVVVASPKYLERAGTPATPSDRSINLRLRTSGRVYAWEFEEEGETQKVAPPGQLIFDSTRLILRAAVEGAGLAMVMADDATPHLERGDLRQVLGDWVAPFPGYYLYYPDRRQHSAAFSLLVEHPRRR